MQRLLRCLLASVLRRPSNAQRTELPRPSDVTSRTRSFDDSPTRLSPLLKDDSCTPVLHEDNPRDLR